VRKFFRAKASRFDADGDDAYVYGDLLGGIVVGTFSMLGFRVKTFDHRSRRRRRGAS
jgi:hypothetical protein